MGNGQITEKKFYFIYGLNLSIMLWKWGVNTLECVWISVYLLHISISMCTCVDWLLCKQVQTCTHACTCALIRKCLYWQCCYLTERSGSRCVPAEGARVILLPFGCMRLILDTSAPILPALTVSREMYTLQIYCISYNAVGYPIYFW